MTISVKVKNLVKAFGEKRAVDDVSFTVEKGEVLGFLGPNGAGKSTTMKMITGYLSPTSGSAIVNGLDITQSAIKVKSLIGYLPEGAPAYQEMTPAQFLAFIAEIRGFKGLDKAKKIDEMVEKVHLREVLHQPIETLSKGFKRRVSLAQAILHDPKVLILDEPTDGLDPNQKHEVRTLIQEMASDKVIVLSTHILEEVGAVCSRAIIIAGGKLIADGTPAELQSQSRYNNAVTLKLSQVDSEAVSKRLEQIGGVSKVNVIASVDEQSHFEIFADKGSTVLNSVSQLVNNEKWSASEIYAEKGRMDDVFRQLTTQNQART